MPVRSRGWGQGRVWVSLRDMIPIFDGHNDTLLLHLDKPDRDFFARQEDGHIDYVRGKEGGFAGGFFAAFAPSYPTRRTPSNRTNSPDERPAPAPPVDALQAVRDTNAMVALLMDWERTSDGRFTIVKTAAQLKRAIHDGVMAAIMHFEGAEAIDPDLASLDVYYAAGLRSLGIVWSRPNLFGHGVPFTFPATPDSGPGLTNLGRSLVRRCNELGIMIDLSHGTEKLFWDVAELSNAPLVCTHSNVHAICASGRNLTDKQLEAVRSSNGVVGLNYHQGFLRPEGWEGPPVQLELMVRHVDYLVDKLGIDKVALGSDYDGASMPDDISDVSKTQNLIEALRKAGYDDAALRKIAHENWVRVLELTWK